MSDSALRLRNRGAYSCPFSGVGEEYFPLGIPCDHAGFVVHEVGYLPCNDWWNFSKVLSPFWRLYYNFRKGHKVIFADNEIELTPEKLMIIPDHQLFHCQGFKSVPSLWMAFSAARRLTSEQIIPIILRPTRTELSLMGDLSRLFSEEGNRDRIFHGGMALLHVVLHRPEIHWRQHTPPAILETISYIEKNFASPITAARLARMAGQCIESLSRSFKKYQGDTIRQFIIKVRVREVAHRLTHTDESIETIAEKTGESPAQFRRRHAVDISS
jgi:AraC family transcriptional regulator of arabinose operon